jgi:hypothetical protein
MDLEPGRIGFMSTQRRENRWQRINCTQRGSVTGFATPLRSRSTVVHTPRLERPRYGSTPATKTCCRGPRIGWPQTLCNRITARYSSLSRTSAAVRRPPGAGCRAASATLATHRSSLPRIASPSVFVCLHSTLPQFPAGKRRWTERYDGKGNLHLLNAA